MEDPSIPPNHPATTSLPPIPTPTHGPGGSFTIACSARIPAPPTSCLDVVLNAPDYPKWNTFCRTCTIDSPPPSSPPNPIPGLPTGPEYLALGTKFTFDVHTGPASETSNGRPTPLEVAVLEPINRDGKKGWRIAWKMRQSLALPSWMLRAERVQEFVEVGEHGEETDYVCWETMYGVLAPVVRTFKGKELKGGFDAWMEGLKGRVGELKGVA